MCSCNNENNRLIKHIPGKVPAIEHKGGMTSLNHFLIGEIAKKANCIKQANLLNSFSILQRHLLGISNTNE